MATEDDPTIWFESNGAGSWPTKKWWLTPFPADPISPFPLFFSDDGMSEQPESHEQVLFSAAEAFERVNQVFVDSKITIALDRRDKLFKDGMTPEQVYNAFLYVMKLHHVLLPVRRDFFDRKSTKV